MSQSDMIIKSKVLQQIPYNTKFRVRRDIMATLDYDVAFDHYVIDLETAVAAEELASEVYYGTTTIKTPASTFQMFKHTHQLSWWMGKFVNRYPVRYDVVPVTIGVELKRYFKYPDANVDFKALGRPVRLETLSELPRN